MTRHWHYVLFRALTSFIFLYAGFKHLIHTDKIFSRIKQCSLYQWAPSQPLYTSLITLSGVVMVVAALFLLAGKYQKWAAAVLLIILTGISITIQLEDLNDLGPFFKNVAIAGSLLFLFKNNNYELQKA